MGKSNWLIAEQKNWTWEAAHLINGGAFLQFLVTFGFLEEFQQQDGGS
jgi:hypothetical protein